MNARMENVGRSSHIQSCDADFRQTYHTAKLLSSRIPFCKIIQKTEYRYTYYIYSVKVGMYLCALPRAQIVKLNLKFGYAMAQFLLKIPSIDSCAQEPSCEWAIPYVRSLS